MGQQEDFRTPGDAADAAVEAPAPPLFDERSARRAAPVVPLERVARRSRFASWTPGGWRDAVSSPQFRRSWPLALLLVATLAAAVAATNFYSHDEATNNATNDATTANVTATADAEITAATPARNENGDSDEARSAQRERRVSPDAATVGNPQAFAASALGSFLGDEGDARDAQGDAATSGHDERGGDRDRGKRQKSSKRRHGPKRSKGGAILFDVIR